MFSHVPYAHGCFLILNHLKAFLTLGIVRASDQLKIVLFSCPKRADIANFTGEKCLLTEGVLGGDWLGGHARFTHAHLVFSTHPELVLVTLLEIIHYKLGRGGLLLVLDPADARTTLNDVTCDGGATVLLWWFP